jgi:chemotaxis protein MotB
VAYADFVTAMMALFIVLWIVGQSKDVKEYVANYFRDPGAFNQTGPGGVMKGSSILPSPVPMPGTGAEGAAATREAQTKAFENMAEGLRETLAGSPEFAQLKDQVNIRTTDVGLLIELLEQSNSTFFDLGAATLQPKTRELLTVMAERLAALPNKIVVEGHTDSRPYQAGAGYSNWELSADRANSARRFMQEHGLRDQQISEVRGYADTRLHNPSDPTDVANRRISIILLYDETKPAPPPGTLPDPMAPIEHR